MTQQPPSGQGSPLPWGPPPGKQVPPAPTEPQAPGSQAQAPQAAVPQAQAAVPQASAAPQAGPYAPSAGGPPPQAPPATQPTQPEPGRIGDEPEPALDREELYRRLAAAGKDRILDTSSGRADGLAKCPRCGSTETHYDVGQVALVCNHCRFAWNEGLLEDRIVTRDISQLRGTVSGSAAGAIQAGDHLVTVKCQGCGAEVVLSADRSLQARCHWCRQVLSLQTQIPNGAVPDAILPFSITHDDAVSRIREFAGKRRFFALPAFRREFTPENVVGVYMPYMMIDANVRADIRGEGEIETRRYSVSVGKDSRETRYDAAVYDVGRRFRFTVDDLTAEASTERANMNTKVNTNNVLNAVQPFDTKLAVGFTPAYLDEFTSEKRDLEIATMAPHVEDQLLSIARSKASETIGKYDRGVRWDEEAIAVDGSRWLAVYLPVWIYSYYQRKGDGTAFTHYIAVNGRTGRTMGSVPVSHPVIAAVAGLAGFAAFVVSLPMVGLLFF